MEEGEVQTKKKKYTHSAIGADQRAGRGPCPKLRPVVLPTVRLGLPNSVGHGHLHNADSDLMHHQYRFSILQWNPGPASRSQGSPSPRHGPIHCVHGQYGLRHLAQQDTFEPNAAVFAFQEAADTWSTVARGTWTLATLFFFSGSPTITFCSVHIHNVVAKNRDASADLLLHAQMLHHNLDFIGEWG